jgi:hypothetical protein
VVERGVSVIACWSEPITGMETACLIARAHQNCTEFGLDPQRSTFSLEDLAAIEEFAQMGINSAPAR